MLAGKTANDKSAQTQHHNHKIIRIPDEKSTDEAKCTEIKRSLNEFIHRWINSEEQ